MISERQITQTAAIPSKFPKTSDTAPPPPSALHVSSFRLGHFLMDPSQPD